MSDLTLNRFVASGTTAERLAFVPSPPTPASGPDPGYLWYDTDLQEEFAYDFVTVGWIATAGGAATAITALTGDVTATGPGSAAATIANDAVTNAKAANMAQSTIKGRAVGAGTGDPTDLTATQATAILDAVVGDSGAGGTKGLVPAPGAGDAAAGKFLKADGTFAVPPGSGGSAIDAFLLMGG